MTLLELIKKYGEGKGESAMWPALSAVSEAVEESMDADARRDLLQKVYAGMSGHHYNEEFAMDDVAKMYYKGADGKEHHAPYWTVDQVKAVYDNVARSIPDYNFWDFFVTLQMIKADNFLLLKRWFPEATAEELDKLLVDLAVNFLEDPDSKDAGHKIWSYLQK